MSGDGPLHLNKWIVRSLFLVGGYFLRWLVEEERGKSFEDEEFQERPRPRRHRMNRNSVPSPTEELKLVLVVNDSLKMGKGKIGAQTAHAAVGIVEELYQLGQHHLLAQWEQGGQPKICLKAKDHVELKQLAALAKQSGLHSFQVADAGRTQIAAGSWTVLAIGPAPRSVMDRVTGHLRLL